VLQHLTCRFRVYSDLRIIFFVSVKSLQTFSSWFWYQWIALDKLYPTLLCASCQDIFVRRRMVFRTAPVTDHRRRNFFFHCSSAHLPCQASRKNSFSLLLPHVCTCVRWIRHIASHPSPRDTVSSSVLFFVLPIPSIPVINIEMTHCTASN
jgi:hypothetical protein